MKTIIKIRIPLLVQDIVLSTGPLIPYSVLLIPVLQLVVILVSQVVALVMEVMKVMVTDVIKYGHVRENVVAMGFVLAIQHVDVIL